MIDAVDGSRFDRGRFVASFTTPLGEVVPAVTCGDMLVLERRWMHGRDSGPEDLAALAGERMAAVVAGWQVAGALRVTVVTGGGWNGAAGVEAARTLALMGHAVTVVPVGGQRRGPGSVALASLRRAPVQVVATGRMASALTAADVVLDAIVGCGLRGRVRPASAEAIRAVNRFSRRIVSADIPSGLDGDTGIPWGPVVRPTATVTFGLPKVGLAQAQVDLSELLLADLRLPLDALRELGLPYGEPFRRGPIVPLRCTSLDGARCREGGRDGAFGRRGQVRDAEAKAVRQPAAAASSVPVTPVRNAK